MDGRLAFEESSGFAWAWLLCLLSPALGDGGARVEGPRLPPYPGQGHPGMHMDAQRMHMDPPRMPFPQGMAMPPGPGQIMWLTAVSAAPPLPTPILALSHLHMSMFACLFVLERGQGCWGWGWSLNRIATTVYQHFFFLNCLLLYCLHVIVGGKNWSPVHTFTVSCGKSARVVCQSSVLRRQQFSLLLQMSRSLLVWDRHKLSPMLDTDRSYLVS